MSYDPFERGPHPAGVRTHLAESSRWPIELWYPAQEKGADDVFATARGERTQAATRDAAAVAGDFPLVVYSHHSGGHRRAATYLCTHLASHGYRVAALDHAETVRGDLQRPATESEPARETRIARLIAARVPDLRFLLDELRATRVGAVGHSLGGWTVLQAADEDPRIAAVVALAPGGAKNPKPGILPLELRFGRSVPTLFIAAEKDVSLPLEGMRELFSRAQPPKQLLVIPRADHLHFVDGVEEEHEAVRAMTFTGALAWISREMRPIGELLPGNEAHRLIRGLTVAHFDAQLKGNADARRFLAAKPGPG
ncbi:MAG TPA: dienelactone hydrolase family protein [Myxococcales bacterium]